MYMAYITIKDHLYKKLCDYILKLERAVDETPSQNPTLKLLTPPAPRSPTPGHDLGNRIKILFYQNFHVLINLYLRSTMLPQNALRRDCNGKCIEITEGHYLEVVVLL